jgi:glycine cleavage system H protein
MAERNNPITRRHFLKEAGLIIGGAALASFAACNGTGRTTEPAETTTAATTPATTTAAPSTAAFAYIPPREPPPLELTPGCATYVAFDRLYSIEHVWVKTLENNLAVVGITEKLVALMDKMETLELPQAGDAVQRDHTFGIFISHKFSGDLISPISGTVVETNDFLMALQKQGQWVETVNQDPYGTGWMMVVQLSNPAELDDMLSPQAYSDLQAKEAAAE